MCSLVKYHLKITIITIIFWCLYFFYQSGRCPLHWAASGGHFVIAEYLIDLSVQVDKEDEVSGMGSELLLVI